jgi:tetratricopeptide (TPR) repeat protein
MSKKNRAKQQAKVNPQPANPAPQPAPANVSSPAPSAAAPPSPAPATPVPAPAPSPAAASAPPAPAPAAPTQAAPDTAIAAGAPPQAPSTAIAAGPPQTAPAQQEALLGSWLADNMHRADVPYLVLVVAIAFFLGSFVARNSEVWLHLGTGRMLSEGNYTLGEDPFGGVVSDGVEKTRPWINHSWLYSWIAYMLYSGDGMLLVILKALAAAALACVLLLIRPHNRHAWAGTLCVLLGVLAASYSGFELHPRMVSMLFLGLTLLILYRAGVIAKIEQPPANPKLLWLLPPLFALWVNLDSWFTLGPIIVFCCLLGLLLDASLGTKPHFPVGQLSKFFGIGLLACLLNPHHYKALLLLPVELSYLLVKMGNFWPESMTAGGRALFFLQNFESRFERNGLYPPTLSPLSGNFWGESSQGLNVGGISFFVLVVLVLLSFYLIKLAGSSMLLVRMVPAFVSLVLALFLAAFIPLFAVVGAVVALLNVQEFLVWRETTQPAKLEEQTLWANMTRLVMGFVFFGLLLLCWPGWINNAIGNFASPRHVAWSIEPDESFRETALFLKDKCEQGQLKRAINFNRDIASYCAWYAPDMRFLTDQRLQLMDREVQMNISFRVEINNIAQREPKIKEEEFREHLRHRGLDCIVGVAFPDQPPSWAVYLGGLVPGAFGNHRWDTIYSDGKMAIVKIHREKQTWWDRRLAEWKWTPARKKISTLQSQWRDQAFGLRDGPWPERIPSVEEPGFWGEYWQRPPQAALSAQKFLMMEQTFEVLNNVHRSFWLDPRGSGKPTFSQVLQAGFLNLANLGIGPLPALYSPQEVLLKLKVDDLEHKKFAERLMAQAQRQGDGVTMKTLQQGFGPKSGVEAFDLPMRWGESPIIQDRGPPEVAVVAVRSVRKAVNESPNDFFSHRVFAKAVQFIDQHQEAYWANNGFIRGQRFTMQGPGTNLRAKLRKFQFVAALQRSVKLRPRDAAVHYELYQYFANENCVDLALRHLEMCSDYIDSSRIEDKKVLEEKTKTLKEMITARETAFETAAKPTDTATAKAYKAMNAIFLFTGPDKQQVQAPFGLFDMAHKILFEFIAEQKAKKDSGKEPDPREQKEAEIALSMLLNIGLITGNFWELDTLVQRTENDEAYLKAAELDPDFHFSRFFYHGVVGDYGAADKDLKGVDKAFDDRVQREITKGRMVPEGPANPLAPQLAADLITYYQPGAMALPALAFAPLFRETADLVGTSHVNDLMHCERLTVRGILAVEAGRTREALEHFQEALKLAGPERLFMDRGIAERYAQLLQGKY